MVRRWGRYATANGALLTAAAIQSPAAGLLLPVMVACGFLLGIAGQVVKLCADSAMQIDVDDALRGHVFAVQDALFWVSFIVADHRRRRLHSRRRPRARVRVVRFGDLSDRVARAQPGRPAGPARKR